MQSVQVELAPLRCVGDEAEDADEEAEVAVHAAVIGAELLEVAEERLLVRRGLRHKDCALGRGRRGQEELAPLTVSQVAVD